MRRALPCAALAVVALVTACGKPPPPKTEVARVVVVDTEALQKLVRGVDAAKQPQGRQQAEDLLRQAADKDPNLWEARYDLGLVLAGAGKLEEAEAELEKAYAMAPNAEDVVMALGEVRRRRGLAAKAATDLTAFVKREPEALDARVLLVAALRESQQFEAAIGQAREVLVRRAGDPNALSELALTHLERGERDTAELLSQEAVKAEPPNAIAERTAGLIALRGGDDAAAFRHFVRASELDPADTTARLNMGTVLLRAGIPDKAAREFRAVLAAAPSDEAAMLGLAAALRGQGRRDAPGPYNEAKKLLTDLLAKDPDNLEATFNLAVLEADFLQNLPAAKPLFEKYLKAAPPAHEGRRHAEKRLSGGATGGGAAPAPAPTGPVPAPKAPPGQPKR